MTIVCKDESRNLTHPTQSLIVRSVAEDLKNIDPDVTPIQMDMVSPALVQVNREFSVVLMSNSNKPLKSLSFDFVANHAKLEILSATNCTSFSYTGPNQIKTQLQGNKAHVDVTLSQGSKLDGVLMLFTLRTADLLEPPGSFAIKNIQARSFDDDEILVAPVDERSVRAFR